MMQQIAQISEIFSSLQGEGTHLGQRHLFLRFEACNIHCEYCDELGKPGFDFDVDSVVQKLIEADREYGPHTFVSLTGGEPLLYVSFLKPLIPKLKEHGFRIYLETSGILWKALNQVIDLTDVVAMDLKPASVTKERSFIKEHEHFLQIALQKETFIKIVISKDIDLQEFRELCEMIQSVIASDAKFAKIRRNPSGQISPVSGGQSKSEIASPNRPFGTETPSGRPPLAQSASALPPRNDVSVPVILQPISAEIEGHDDPELMRLLGELQTLALGMLSDVRIVPRLHKILNIK